MSEHEKVETELVVHDSASVPLRTITGAAEKLMHSVKHLTGLLAGVGGLAGAFEIHEAVNGINETFRAINRVRTMTGLAANTAHGLKEAFDQSGIEAGETERIIMSLTRKTQTMDDVGGASLAAYNAKMKKLGINIKEDVVGQLEAMSIAAQKGKIDIGDLGKLFGVRGEGAVKMLEMLEKGPENIKAIVEETAKNGITAIDMGNFNRMQAAKRALGSAFGDMIQAVYKHLLPGVTAVVNQVREAITAWTPKVESFGLLLRNHMHEAIHLAKIFVQIMAAKSAMGYLGLTPKGIISGAAGMFVGGVGGAAAGGSKALGGGLLGILGGAGGGLLQLLLNFGKLSVIGVVIAAAIGAFKLLSSNFHGWGDRLSATFAKLRELFEQLMEQLKPAFEFLADKLFWLADQLMKAFSWFLDKVLTKPTTPGQALANVMGQHQARAERAREMYGPGAILPYAPGEIAAISQLSAAATIETAMGIKYKLVKGQLEAGKRLDEANKDIMADIKSRAGIKQDFRGSKFDITQNFAEGFEPDRIAAAFAGQLAAVGERQVSSGMASPFGVR